MISEPISSQAERDEILRRTFNGAKWMLYLSASALVTGFFTNVILGRIGAETLGFYSLLMLIVSMIQTFFVFGASNVLVNYLPNLTADTKPRFVLSYSILVYAVGTLLLAICLLFPSVLQLVFRQELNMPIGMYMTILVPILLAQVLVWAILQAELEGTVLAVSQNAVSWFYFLSIGLMVMLGLLSTTTQIGLNSNIFVVVVVSNLVALAIGAFFIGREYISIPSIAKSWFLPPGFWTFTVSLHFGTLFNFMISNAAPVFILRELGLRELGYFRAASVFAAFVSWVPSVFDKSFYPSFCNLVSKRLPTDKAYARFSRLNAISSSIVALVIILFTRELLSVFGKEFSESSYFLLIMLSAGFVISTPFIQINFALVTAYLKTPHTMAVYALSAVAGIILYGSLVPRYGLEGIAMAFIALQAILFVLSWGLTWYFTHSRFPLRPYLITLCVVCVGLIGAHNFGSLSIANVVIKLGLSGVLVLVLISTKLVTKAEIKEVFSVILPRYQ
jgi:O-antigen/teichoic acid export membrane protein